MSALRFLTAGESHGPGLVAIVDGMPSGVPLTPDDVAHDLARRQVGYGRGGRMAIERDVAEVVGGLAAGMTTGAPVALLVRNRDWENWRGREWPRLPVPRPGHADLAGYLKHELGDCRPVLERASARETAARVAAGAVARALLHHCGVSVGSYVERIGAAAMVTGEPEWRLAEAAEASDVRCPDEATAVAMRQAIDAARERGDSLGGVFVVLATGLPPGLGSHTQWDRRLDGRLAQALTSVQAVKGVEIGPAFANAAAPGTQVHDAICLPPGTDAASLRTADAGRLRPTNRAGGLEGGMTTGQPLVLRAAMKPIPTTVSAQPSLNLDSGEPAATQYQRSDVCAVPAASVVGEAMVALVLADALLDKFGGDSLAALQAALERYLSLPLTGRGSEEVGG
ncbi:MAG: chorismate synthase [Anaerolineae bacterium]